MQEEEKVSRKESFGRSKRNVRSEKKSCSNKNYERDILETRKKQDECSEKEKWKKL